MIKHCNYHQVASWKPIWPMFLLAYWNAVITLHTQILSHVFLLRTLQSDQGTWCVCMKHSSIRSCSSQAKASITQTSKSVSDWRSQQFQQDPEYYGSFVFMDITTEGDMQIYKGPNPSKIWFSLYSTYFLSTMTVEDRIPVKDAFKESCYAPQIEEIADIEEFRQRNIRANQAISPGVTAPSWERHLQKFRAIEDALLFIGLMLHLIFKHVTKQAADNYFLQRTKTICGVLGLAPLEEIVSPSISLKSAQSAYSTLSASHSFWLWMFVSMRSNADEGSGLINRLYSYMVSFARYCELSGKLTALKSMNSRIPSLATSVLMKPRIQDMESTESTRSTTSHVLDAFLGNGQRNWSKHTPITLKKNRCEQLFTMV